ncbi:Uncharacterised protein [Moraxella caprae]|uniref:Uncharacterized protein n=1 Tax=Moraxella caprae TaxID=90240 RepID=A0A378QY14_9GAMM|nr:hypothetical protein [Moraxella caprae]STZ07854.1 Uncharacterised protein [Moraxella caprae]
MLSFHNVDKRKNSIATAPAFAETTVYQTILSTTPSVELPTQPTQATDLSFAFDDTQNLQAVAMTDSEMQETEGAWVANAVGAGFGGLTGHFAYMGSVAASGQYNFGHHVAAVGTGAGLGFVSPVSAAGRAIAMSAGTKVATNTAISLGGPTAGVVLGNRFKTLNVK